MSHHRELANAIRVLAMDAVQKAQSGHPGMPMGMADIAEVLWRRFLRFNPSNPNWPNRDRFVLSNGHGALLLYSVLHLTGFEVSMDDLRNFRQLDSKTPGHPEYGHTPGVEATTGPLGQGLAMAVGMALAEKHMAAYFNRQDHVLIDHFTYVFAGDGCLMEGISHEACSLAGTWGLGKLIVFYDDNGISIDGPVREWFSDNTAERFRSYYWHVLEAVDGHNAEEVAHAIERAQQETERPSLILCKTQIGYGAPNKVGTAAVHGAPLGEDEVARAREALGWTHPPFFIPPSLYKAWDRRAEGQALEDQWRECFAGYEQAYPQLAQEFLRRQCQELPGAWQEVTDQFIHEMERLALTMATRKASLACLNAYAPLLPELIGGSADLSGSNCTKWKEAKAFSSTNPTGNYLHYGVREFGMMAVLNGIALYKGFLPNGGTFLVFSDYARNALRLSAMMGLRVIQVLTHDSIGVGEDGPTHQPIEHAASLRLIPHLDVWRPCDATETAVAWQQAILRTQGPSSLLLTRQDLPHLSRSPETLQQVAKGGYVIFDPPQSSLDLLPPELSPELPIEGLFIATGSEVHLAVAAAQSLLEEGFFVRVVSMPCCELFKRQPARYQDQVLPPGVKARVAMEAGVPDGWYQFVGRVGAVLGIECYGKSAPSEQVFADLGVTTDKAKELMRKLLRSQRQRLKEV